MAKLTDKTAASDIATGDLFHMVDVSDTSSSPEGTSKKLAFSTIVTAGSEVWQDLPTSNTETLSANKTLTEVFEQWHFLDPNGADRDVTAWASPTSGQQVIINNNGSANTLQFKNNGGTAIGNPIAIGITVRFFYNGTDWKVV